MSDRLTEIFKIQKAFSEKYFIEQQKVKLCEMTEADLKKWTKEYILCSSKELYEMLDELPWKQHRFIKQNHNIDNFIEEGVDAFKFLLNLFLLHGCTEEQFFQKFIDKSKVVDIRYEQEKKLKELKDKKDVKLAVIDIDGIVCNHSSAFLSRSIYRTVHEFKTADINAYNQLKHEFRTSGFKRNAPVINGAQEFLKNLKDNGYLILLLTARPYEKIIRIYADTLYWLESNSIIYDFLFFNKNKEQFIIDNLSPEQVKFCLDDDIENVNKLALYFTTYLMPNYTLYDRREIVKVRQNVRIVDSFEDIKL